MHLCLVSLDFKPYRSSGLTIYAEDLARGLLERGHQVTVLAARRPGLPAHHRVDGVEVHRIIPGRVDWITYSWHAANYLHRLAKNTTFDLVHFLDVHFAYAYRGAYVASLWQSFRQRLTADAGRPYHTSQFDLIRRQMYYRIAQQGMERPSLARAGRLIASCQTTRAEFISAYQVPADKIDLGTQGINTEYFQPVPSASLRQKLGLEGCFVLLFVGFMNPRKGLEHLARAMQQLPPHVHLILAGRWEKGCRARVWEAFGEAVSRVHEVGFLPDEALPAYYSLADLYVSPSLLEGLGITPIEAMACGTPALVTDATSGPEEVGEGGVVVPARDADALAEAVLRFVHHPETLIPLQEICRTRVVQLFSFRRMTDLTLESYARFLNPNVQDAPLQAFSQLEVR